MRVSIEAALRADPELSAGVWRVLAAIIHEVPTWSRLTDTVARRKIAERAGLTERTVSRAVNRLVTVGAIEWTPGDGAGNTSQVALPIERETDTRPPYERERGTDAGPPSGSEKGDRIAGKGGQSSVQKGRHRPAVNGASTRSTREDFVSEEADGETSNESDPLIPRMAAVCTARDRVSVLTSSRRVFDHCALHVDRRIIDEVIGEAAQWPSPPRWPSAILERIQQRAATYGIDVPDLELNPNGRRRR